MWKGIDVSDNQGVIDWGKAAAAGVQFAILRSVRRSGQADHRFGANLEGCRRHKIPAAVYRYTYAVTEAQAEEEAGQVTALLRSHGLAGTMVWWDVEDRERLQPLGSTKLTELIRAAQAPRLSFRWSKEVRPAAASSPKGLLSKLIMALSSGTLMPWVEKARSSFTATSSL